MKKTTSDAWFLYILKCKDATYYTGVTNDLERRLRMHQEGTASRYTRSRLPVKMLYHETCESRSDALKKEHAIKKLSRSDKEAYMRNYGH